MVVSPLFKGFPEHSASNKRGHSILHAENGLPQPSRGAAMRPAIPTRAAHLLVRDQLYRTERENKTRERPVTHDHSDRAARSPNAFGPWALAKQNLGRGRSLGDASQPPTAAAASQPPTATAEGARAPLPGGPAPPRTTTPMMPGGVAAPGGLAQPAGRPRRARGGRRQWRQAEGAADGESRCPVAPIHRRRLPRHLALPPRRYGSADPRH